METEDRLINSGQWMREQGFPSDKYILLLPVKLRPTTEQSALWPPSYVRFSPLVDRPTFVLNVLSRLVAF